MRSLVVLSCILAFACNRGQVPVPGSPALLLEPAPSEQRLHDQSDSSATGPRLIRNQVCIRCHLVSGPAAALLRCGLLGDEPAPSSIPVVHGDADTLLAKLTEHGLTCQEASQLTLFEGQLGHASCIRQYAYIAGHHLVPGGEGLILDPLIEVLDHGEVVEVEAVVAEDGAVVLERCNGRRTTLLDVRTLQGRLRPGLPIPAAQQEVTWIAEEPLLAIAEARLPAGSRWRLGVGEILVMPLTLRLQQDLSPLRLWLDPHSGRQDASNGIPAAPGQLVLLVSAEAQPLAEPVLMEPADFPAPYPRG